MLPWSVLACRTTIPVSLRPIISAVFTLMSPVRTRCLTRGCRAYRISTGRMFLARRPTMDDWPQSSSRVMDGALTRREHDCLRHLGIGLTTVETAAALGISRSTLNAHLMSARRKLGVRNTAQALLAIANEDGGRPPPAKREPWSIGRLEVHQSLADQLSRCDTFAGAWRCLHEHVAMYGITTINFGVIADPMGALDDRSYSFWSSLPEELIRLYYEMGGAPADPVARYVVHGTAPLISDPEYVMGLEGMPPAVRAMGTALMDTHLNRQLCIPHRDPATGAATCLSFAFDVRHRSEFESIISARSLDLTEITRIFWDSVQHGRLLAEARGLTVRQREALALLARGFTLDEAADWMHVSLRSVEKCLAGARAKLGTRTNAQSVYRAIVYRALP